MNRTSPRSMQREQRGELALVLDGRACAVTTLQAELVAEDVRDGGLAQAGRAAEEDVIERLAALARRLHVDVQVVHDLALADELGEARGAQRAVEVAVALHAARRRRSLLPCVVGARARPARSSWRAPAHASVASAWRISVSIGRLSSSATTLATAVRPARG